jgi:hypothetical protein
MWNSFWQMFKDLDTSLQATIVSIIVGGIAGFFGAFLKIYLEKKSYRDRLAIDYEFIERKKLRELSGKYHGRILEASDRVNLRLENLQKNQAMGWLNVSGQYDIPDKKYYFSTTIYRFVELYSLIYLFRSEAIYIDSRYAKEGEPEFLKFTKALEWVITDVELFKGLNYDINRQWDHIFKDRLQLLCGSCILDGRVISMEELYNKLSFGEHDRLLPFLMFFDGLNATEKRCRWDRIVAFHLLLMSFINRFGYEDQKSKVGEFLAVAKSCNHLEVLTNLSIWIPKLGLQKETKDLLKSIRVLQRDLTKVNTTPEIL